MKFKIIEEKLCKNPKKLVSLKKVALSLSSINLSKNVEDIIEPLQIATFQNNLNMVFLKFIQNGIPCFLAIYSISEMEKARHIIAKSTVLN